jgi:IPT/TIG domain
MNSQSNCHRPRVHKMIGLALTAGLILTSGFALILNPWSSSQAQSRRTSAQQTPRSVDSSQNRSLRIPSTSAAPGSEIEVPVELTATGDENALGFTVSFDPQALVLDNAVAGDGVDDAALEINWTRVASGRVGIAVALPSGVLFSAGTHELARLHFKIASASGGSTEVAFGNDPVVCAIAGTGSDVLNAAYASGMVKAVDGFEGDVTPRPTGRGDGTVTAADWVQVGRFAAGLDNPENGSEFQRADVAPRSSHGDGQITVADWVQAGRYAASLDSVAAAAGPAFAVGTVVAGAAASDGAPSVDASIVRIPASTVNRGQDNNISIELVSQGTENAVGFSLVFDPSQVTFVRAVAGSDLPTAPIVNTSNVSAGQVGITFSLAAGKVFAAGTRQVLVVTFNVLSTSNVNSTAIGFGSQPVPTQVVDANAQTLPSTFTGATLSITPQVNVAPTITSLSPDSATAGGAGFVLTVNGTGFTPSSTVQWNGSDRATTFGSSTKITALISAEDISTPGVAVTVAVFTPPPGGGLSNLASFLITNPLPTLSSLSQTVVQTGSPGFTLIVTGANISQLAKVRFNSTELQTTFLSPTQLAGQVPGSLLGTAGKNTITIVNPSPGGGTSNGLTLEVRNPSPIPRLTSLSPTSIGAGSPAFTLTLNGNNFVESSIVRWNGQDLATTFFSSTQLTAQVPVNNISTPGSATINVFNPTPGGGNSNPLPFTIDPSSNPSPQIDSLSPMIISTGSPSVLTVNGSRFVPASVVRVNGSDRPTTFVSANQLTVALTSDDVKSPGQLSISVFNPPPAGGTSLPVAVTVANGLPRITILDPNPVGVGGAAFNLTVNGSNFVPSSVVQAHGVNRTTTYVSSTQLIAAIPASDIATVGSTTIAVVNPPPGGGTSAAAQLQIAYPTPAIVSLDPQSALPGGTAFKLTINGTGFVPASVIRINNTDRITTFISSTQLSTEVPASDIAAAGALAVVVVSPIPGGGSSNVVSFPVSTSNPLPVIGNLSPTSGTAGSSGLTVTISGSGFIAGSIGRWNNSDRGTTFVNANQLMVQITAADLATPGTATITVFNPPPNGGTSAPLIFSINNPVPVIASLNPASVNAGGGDFTLTVVGSNFISGAFVQINGANRNTSFINSTTLTAAVPASDIAVGGSAVVTVVNPGPGGGASNGVNLTINNPAPTLSSLSPAGTVAGGPGFVLTVNGSNFVPGSVVRVNGQGRQTSFVNAGQLTVGITAQDIAVPGALSITVFNPAPGGGVSAALSLVINVVPPMITSISPSQVGAGGAAFTLVVNGSGFTSASVVLWNGSARTTTFVSTNQLTAMIPSTDIAAVGTATVTVTNGGAVSNGATFTIQTPVCVVACFESSEFYRFNANQIPATGTIRIGNNGAVVVLNLQSNASGVLAVLGGGTTPQARLNAQYAALQLNLLTKVDLSTPEGRAVLNSTLACQGASIVPVQLSTGITITGNTSLASVIAEVEAAIIRNSNDDMTKLTAVLLGLNGTSNNSRCTVAPPPEN